MDAGIASLLQGSSGLIVAYAAVEVPLLSALVRRGARLPTLLAAPILGFPLTAAAGLGIAAISPLLRGLGIGANSVMQLAVGTAVFAAAGYATARALTRPPKPKTVHQRGTLIREQDSQTDGGRAATRGVGLTDARQSAVTLAGIPLSLQDETKHFKLIGTTGTGKSTAIREILGAALARGDRAIIADPDGGYLARFRSSQRGDLVLNPFEADARKWDLFGEIDNAYDVDQLARSLLPDHGAADRSWVGYARTFFCAVTRQAHEAGVKDLSELYRLLVVAEASELRTFLKGTPAQPFLDPQNGRMFDSIRSVTSSAVGPLEYVARQGGEPLSVRGWVREAASGKNGQGGVLFIPYRAGQIAALRGTISAWMRLAIFEALSQPEGDQRLWFVVDELDALGQIDGLKDALARLRKFGGRCVLGFQSLAQVSATYGSGEAQTLIENCGNTLILRCSGSDHGGTANFASRLIGQREMLRISTSHSRRPMDFMASTTQSEHLAIEPAVMDSQIEQLPDLSGYLKLASAPDWRRVRLRLDEGSGDSHSRGSAEAQTQATRVWRSWRQAAASPRPGAEPATADLGRHRARANPGSADSFESE